MNSCKVRRGCVALGFILALPVVSAQEDVSAECRGVAAGVVAGMRAAGEIPDQRATEVAVVAARRACSAALEGFDSAGATAGTPAPADGATAADGKKTVEKMSVWEFITQDGAQNPGNERLKRLRN